MERVESRLYSALGEELKHLEDNAGLDNGLLSSLEELGSPLVKCRTQGTLGGERGMSPDTKSPRESAKENPQPLMRGD